MIIPPARANPGRRATARSASVPAPVGGWNARDALDGMRATDAILLDNYIPSTDNVKLRRGYASHATGLGTGVVKTLISFSNGSTARLLGAANGNIYNCTSSGAVGAALASGFSSDEWQYEIMGGNALLFNGVDSPQKYDGSTVSSNSITGSGLTASNLIYPWAFKQRIFAIEKNTLNAWYLGTSAISGSASKLDFSSYCPMGGTLVAGGTWTRDGGSGSDDLCVFITSRGEVLVYQGTDPASSSTWGLVGVFRIAPPVGKRPLLRVGPDLVVITIDGFLPLSGQLSVDRAAPNTALSEKIRKAVSDSTRSYGSIFGWESIHYPRGSYILFNVPLTTEGKSHQYVMNTITRSWCRFTGMNASCWAVFQDRLYFGGQGGVVYLADSGTSDNGDNIVGDIWPAFNYFGARGLQKRFTMMRPITASEGSITYTYTLNVDYSDRFPTVSATALTEGSNWDTSDWDVAEWGAETSIQRQWLSITGVGFCASPHLRTSTNSMQPALNSIDYVFEVGGVL